MRNRIQFPCTVRQYAESVGRSQSYVRDHIRRGDPVVRCPRTPDMFPETLEHVLA